MTAYSMPCSQTRLHSRTSLRSNRINGVHTSHGLLSCAESGTCTEASWFWVSSDPMLRTVVSTSRSLSPIKQRGLTGVRLFVSDKCLGLVEQLAEFYPAARWQRCVVHFYRNVWTAVPRGKVKEVAAMLKAIHAQEDGPAARQKAQQVVGKLRKLKLAKAAELVATGIGETLSYDDFPREHWRCLRTNNPLERIMREIRRRTRVVGAFPDGQSALMLVAARLRHIAGTKWGTRRYLDMDRLKETAAQAA